MVREGSVNKKSPRKTEGYFLTIFRIVVEKQSIYKFQNLCRHTAHHCIGRHILGDYGTGGNHSVVPDGNTSANGRIGANHIKYA